VCVHVYLRVCMNPSTLLFFFAFLPNEHENPKACTVISTFNVQVGLFLPPSLPPSLHRCTYSSEPATLVSFGLLLLLLFFYYFASTHINNEPHLPSLPLSLPPSLPPSLGNQKIPPYKLTERNEIEQTSSGARLVTMNVSREGLSREGGREGRRIYDIQGYPFIHLFLPHPL